MSKFFALAALFIGHAMSKRTVARIGIYAIPLAIVFGLFWGMSASMLYALYASAVFAGIIVSAHSIVWCIINYE